MPELAPALTHLPMRDQPKVDAPRSPHGPAPRLSVGGALLSAAVRREPARRDGEVVMSMRRRGVALLAPALLAAAVLSGCGGGEPEESAGDLLSRAKTTLDDAESAHFVLTSENAPDSGTAAGRRRGRHRPAVVVRGHAQGARARLDRRSRGRLGRRHRLRPAALHLRLQRRRPGPVRLRRPRRAARPRDRHLPAAGRGRERGAGGGAPGRRRGRARGDRRAARRPRRADPHQRGPEHAGARRASRSPPTAASCAGPS